MEANGTKPAAGLVSVTADGAQAASDMRSVLSPETYVGYDRAENFVSPGGIVDDARHSYEAGMPRRNEWSLAGDWTIGVILFDPPLYPQPAAPALARSRSTRLVQAAHMMRSTTSVVVAEVTPEAS